MSVVVLIAVAGLRLGPLGRAATVNIYGWLFYPGCRMGILRFPSVCRLAGGNAVFGCYRCR
jgi:hypothetical protein